MKKLYLFVVIVLLFFQKALPQASFSIAGNLCERNILKFNDESVVPITNWFWDFGDGNSSIDQNPLHAYTDSGFYNVILTITSNGNNYNSNRTIHISSHPIVNFSINDSIFKNSSYSRIFIDSSTAYNPISLYVWNFGDGSAPISTKFDSTLYKYSEKGTYEVWLKVIDNKGCADSVSKSVSILDIYYIPNVFTPNGDEINEEFIVTSNGETLFSIEIYSRWGNLVFKRSGVQQIRWDGRMPDGSKVKPGTYYYVISSVSGDVTYDPQKGFITVFY